ncbi:MAG TPA: TfoX/Sxy family protein [Thermoplasmata archaeon]|nr:TfoX/Sxy family protein [Thermoplasmata archaeon]
MPYNEELAGRVRSLLRGRADVTEKEMVGGLAFLLRGKMCVGVRRDNLLIRVGPDRYEQAPGRSHARKVDSTGRPMRGWVYVDPRGTQAGEDLARWVAQAVGFVESLR